MNNCSKIKCPLNALTFKDCNLTEKECCYFTKQPTNGDVIKAMFPTTRVVKRNEYLVFVEGIDEDSNIISFFVKWWDAPYKSESENK